MSNITSLFSPSSKAKDIPASLAHSDPIPTESVLLNFTTHRLVGLFVQADLTTFPKLDNSSLGLLQMDHIHYH